MPNLVLLRHGESQWNLENRFTGCVDVPLSPKGEEEARRAGLLLQDVPINIVYTSVLKRAVDTATIALKERGGSELPTVRDKALNERHYGDLQGLNKAEVAEQYGNEQLQIWRRSYDVPPPHGESLKDTASRTLPYFNKMILADIKSGKNVLVVAHGNSLRSIVMYLDKLTPEQVVELNIPTGLPLLYELNSAGQVLSCRYLTNSLAEEKRVSVCVTLQNGPLK
jgi:2,3-bisphosphoglycerate-dependent phosphoglycerate mutase